MSQKGRSRSLPRVRAGLLQSLPPMGPIPASFGKQHSCYRHNKEKVKEKEKDVEKEKEVKDHKSRALDGQSNMSHRSLRPCCRQRKTLSNGPSPILEKNNASAAAAAAASSANANGGGKGRKGPMPMDERPPFNLDTRIEGEDEVDELTGKYIRKKDIKTVAANGQMNGHQQLQHNQQTAFGSNTQFGGASGGGGDPTAYWVNSLRESFHRTVRLS